MKTEKKDMKKNIEEEIKKKDNLVEKYKNNLDYQITKCRENYKKDEQLNQKIKCYQKKNLWTSDDELLKIYRFENKSFNPEKLKEKIPIFSEKLDLLFRNINRLDKKFYERTKKIYKHVIFVKNSNYQGMKLLISCMIAKGYNFLLKSGRGLKIEKKNSNKNFLCMTSGKIYNKEFNKKITKEVNQLFNSRPDNIYGEQCRFLLIDYNYKEGIDLYDAKFFHILDPYLFETEMEQLIGRNTRRCGQSGLPFEKQIGWKLLVYLYNNKIGEKRDVEKIIRNLRMKKININKDHMKIRNVLNKTIKENAIDKLLTDNIHKYKN
jgi:hypothetical protein